MVEHTTLNLTAGEFMLIFVFTLFKDSATAVRFTKILG